MRSLRLYEALVSGLLFSALALHAQPSRIAGPIDDNRQVELPGNAPLQTQLQVDQGAVDPSFPMAYVTLYTMPTADQQKALAKLLADQQDRSSPKYHHWLAPEQYGDNFGLNPADIEKIASWLQAEGFTVKYKARGRNWIAFSGTAGQIANTFRTEIHRYVVDGQTHFANATNPSIPAALAGVVAGIRGLNDFHPRPLGRRRGSGRVKPDYTGTFNFVNYLAPGDVATIYDLGPLYNLNIDGTGQTVVVVGDSDIYSSDIADFRSVFGLPSQPQQYWPSCDPGSLCMVLVPGSYPGGGDPGNYADLSEADLDLEWVGAVARNATVLYVYAKNVFDSAFYAIDNNLGPVLSMSYGYCEADYQMYVGSLAYGQSEAQKANSFGITWLAASGDAGAAGCNRQTDPLATRGLAVSAPASIPEVTAVGGTEFNEGSGRYWNYFSGANGGTATSYIPEMGWNDTGYGTGLSPSLAASGGGFSSYFPKPSWQTGSGFPNDGGRDVPDVALSASWDHDPYIICYNNVSCFDIFGDPNNPNGGTSASTPVFAGILVLLNHYLVSYGFQAQAGLGNVNPTLYWLAQNSPAAFHDITVGNNIVPCQTTSTDCGAGSFGYSAGPGYDEVTGLGSVDGYNLITSWPWPSSPQISSITPPTPSAGSQNQSITVYGSGFQSNLTVTVFFPNNGGSSTVQGPGQIQNVTLNSFQMTIGFNGPGTWGIQAKNPDGMTSNLFDFTVNPASSGGALPDLVVTSLTASSSGNPAGSINISATVKNQGLGGAGPFRLEFYFSATSAFSLSTAIDTTWGCSFNGGLAAGASEICSGPIAVPVILTPGPWYLVALADSNNQVVESNENNNWRIADTGPVALGATLKILGAGLDGNLYSIVPTAGATTLIGPMPTVMSDIAAYHGSLYGISLPPLGSSSVLYSLDPSSGAGTAIGSGTGVRLNALVFSSGGTLYAAGGDSLYIIDTSTGYATLVGSGTGSGVYQSSGDLAFDFPGNLYLTSGGVFGDQLFSLNLASGQGTLIGNIGFSSVYGLAYYNGTAFGFTSGGQVVSINLSTGAGIPIATYTPGFNGTTVFAPTAPATCTYAVSPTAVYLDSNSQYGPSVNVTTGQGCLWWESSNVGFITITSWPTGSGSGTVTYKVGANYTGADLIGTLTVAGQQVSVTQRETSTIFTDVNPPDYYFDFANVLYTQGISSGCSNFPLQYCPSAAITRAEMAVFIITSIEGGNTFSYTTTPYFTDVPPTNSYFKFIQKMKDLGITGGCSATMFCPDGTVTRGEMAVFIITGRYESTPYTYPSTPYFTDVPPSNPFFPFIQKMAQSGITGGCAPNLFCPNETLTRGQMSIFIVTGLLNQLLGPTVPLVTMATPNQAAPGQVLDVTLTGVHTHFAAGATQVTTAPYITPTFIVVNSETSLTVQLVVSASAPPNPTSIVVTTGAEEAVLPNGFTVQ